MAVLLIHSRPEILAAWHVALTAQGFDCLTALGEDSARLILAAQREPGMRPVSALVAEAAYGEVVKEWREALGAVPAVLLGEGEGLLLARRRWPEEWILPQEPFPVEVLAAWLAGQENQSPAPQVETDSVVPLPAEAGFAPVSRHTGPVSLGAAAPRLGDYELLELIEETEKTKVYRAWQHSVQRVVVLERLKSAWMTDPTEVAAFRAQVRAQAAAVHPVLAAVYEALEQEELIFYTREWLDAARLSELPEQGRWLTEEAALSVLAAAAQVVNYLRQAGLARAPLTPDVVRVAADGTPRVVNVARGGEPAEHPERAEIRALLHAVRAAMRPGTETPALRALEARLKDKRPRRRIAGWPQFETAVAEVSQSLAPAMPRRRRSTRRPVSRGWLLVAAASVVAASFFVAERWPYWQAPKPRLLDEMVRIPGGEFIYQQGETRHLPAFWIDKYEVSLAHYDEFLHFCRAHPDLVPRHPRQPASKTSHEPRDWEERMDAARRGAVYRGVKLDVNCPVTGVDFWDAWAYAAWKGRRLPTEMEWEKAARGAQGFLYPWGNVFDSTKANMGRGEKPNGKASRPFGPAPVDAYAETDVSPYGVTNMAGNVAEWTASTTFHPDLIDVEVPLVCGGAYDTKPVPLLARRPAKGYEEVSPSLGFRTAADLAP